MTDPKTLARTNDPPTSKDAAKEMVDSGKLNKQEQIVYEEIIGYIGRHNKKDFTTKDIARYWWPSDGYEICKRRFSDLANKGKIEVVGGDRCLSFVKRRDGCRVYRLL